MRRSSSLALPALALAATTLFAQEAEAKGLMIVTYGEAVMHYADLATEVRQALKDELGHEVQAGYLYSNFGVFWLDLWTWGGEYCLYEGDQVWKVTPDELAAVMNTTPDKLGRPLLYTFPLGLCVLLGLGLGAFAWSRLTREKPSAGASTEPPAAEV